MSQPLSIDIWSDIACPWCYIGMRNLERGLAATASDEDAPQVAITFRSFELSPDTPADYVGGEIDHLADHKGVPREQIEQMLDRVAEVATPLGLELRFDRVQHANTVKAHELLHHAKAQGRQRDMKDRLMAAYFTEGRNVGRIDELVDLAAEVGLDPEAADEALRTDRYVAEVRQDEQQARAYGIQGVPFFVIDGKYGLSGAQPPEAFAGLLRELWAERHASLAQAPDSPRP